MIYTSIVPSEMTNKELCSISKKIIKGISASKITITVALTNGQDYKVDVDRLEDYQNANTCECGMSC